MARASRIESDAAKRIKLTCPTCGKEYAVPPCRAGQTHCSAKCAKADDDLIRARVEKRIANGSYRPEVIYSKSKRGVRRGQYFRSRMEANYAAYLDFVGVKWEYEPKTFWFPVKRGVVSYTPDFYLPDEDKYVETKGWMDPKSKTKIRRMAIHHKDVKLEVVDWKAYKEIAKWSKLIPNWESDD